MPTTTMQISPLIPILCLLAGALVVQVSAVVRFRWPSLIIAIATGLAAAAMSPLVRQLPAMSVALDWRPVTLFGSTASLRVDGTAWLLGLAMLIAGFSVALTWLVVPGSGRPAPRALALVMLAAGLGSAFAANLLTLVLCWGVLDALFCLSVLARGGPTSGRRAQVALGLNGVATLAVWVVAVLIQQDHLSPYWHLLILPPTARLLLGLAAALRLGLYPLHIWQPVELVGEPDRAILIYLVPAMAGLSLWARLAVIQGLPEGNLWPVIALATALIGGVLAWIQADPRESLPHLALGYGGMLILAATVGKAPAETLAAGSASWLLGLTLLFVGRPFMRQTWLWAIPAALGVATLAGLPWTLGFVNRSTFYQSALAGPGWILVLAIIAEIFLVAAMLRRVLTPDTTPVPQGLVPAIGYASALVVAAAPVIIFGVILLPTAAPTVRLSIGAWIGWSVPLAGGVALTFMAERVRARLSGQGFPSGDWGAVAGQIMRLDWLYSLLMPLMRSPARVGLWLGDLLEGDGAFLWMLLILALVTLYLRGG
jgi:formate hydrogenlyase subunit 3/multisubunit Na+/H+ antiporter MnhD subunit